MARAMQPAGHIHNVLELHRRGVDEAKISGLSAEEAKKLLDELQQQVQCVAKHERSCMQRRVYAYQPTQRMPT